MANTPSKTSEKKITQARFDNNVYERLTKIAEKEMRSINNMIEYFVKVGVEEYERTHQD